MRFEKDKKITDTIKVNIFVYVAFIGLALGFAARYCFAETPQYLIAAALVACGAYMAYYLLRFIRLLKTVGDVFLQINEDKVSGLAFDPRKCTGEAFELGLSEVTDVSLQKYKMTRRTLLPILTIRTASRVMYVFGIEDIQTARNRLLPENWM